MKRVQSLASIRNSFELLALINKVRLLSYNIQFRYYDVTKVMLITWINSLTLEWPMYNYLHLQRRGLPVKPRLHSNNFVLKTFPRHHLLGKSSVSAKRLHDALSPPYLV